MTRPVRIGNAHGFWGDRIGAAAEMLMQEPDLDFLTLDFLAEVSMSILAAQQARDPNAGFPKDFVEIIRSLAPYWREGGKCRLISNAGGLNPLACAQACCATLADHGCSNLKIGVIAGDDVLETIRADVGETQMELLVNLDTGAAIDSVNERLVTANAYLGARAIATALDAECDIVIAGRVADPSLTVAACSHHFGWDWDDWNRLAGATIAGHLIECGTQVTGGICTDWLDVPDVDRIGFPIVEVSDEGECIVTKPIGTGGCVTEQTVKEQLLYEIGDPSAYLSPDVTVSFLSLSVEDQGHHRVRVAGAMGDAFPSTYKVSATYRDGFRSSGQLTVIGADAQKKARRAADSVLRRLIDLGCRFEHTQIECTTETAAGEFGFASTDKTNVRISVADASKENVDRFAREIMSLVTCGPQGTTGYSEGRPRVHEFFRFWPCLIERSRVEPSIEYINVESSVAVPDRESRKGISHKQPSSVADSQVESDHPNNGPQGDRHVPVGQAVCLGDVAYARSGDKGIHANIGVIARRGTDIEWLGRQLTAERVAAFLGIEDASRVQRFELSSLAAFNFVVRFALDNPLRIDAQGKAIGQQLLSMPIHDQDESGRKGA